MNDRIIALEEKVCFQEQYIEELNTALSQQQLTIDKMQLQLKFLAGKLHGVQSSNIADQKDETPPPHY